MTENETKIFHTLESIDLETIIATPNDRRIPGRKLARLAGKLFRELNLRTIAVTAMNFSKTQSIEVILPGGESNRTIMKVKVKAILEKAFPNHDYCWSIY